MTAKTSPAAAIAIRPARPADEAAILAICLRTADGGQDGTQCHSDPRLPGFVWALPYLRLCPQQAFVVTRAGVVMGYCVAATDTVTYEQRLAEAWWPELRNELRTFSARTPQDAALIAYIADPPRTLPAVAAPYPAHLHINLLPDLQQGGHGSTLLAHQLEALSASGAVGVHVGIDPRNAAVTGFYQKSGFVEIGQKPSLIMGKRLP